MIFRRSRAARSPFSDDQVRAIWQLVSLLISYPDVGLTSQLPDLAQLAVRLPQAAREPLTRLIAHLQRHELGLVQRDYVETFDHTRRCCLHLTYFAHGDTRKRGVALVQVKQAYRHSGVEFENEELPDHLSVVLEFGAFVNQSAAWRLLIDHRAGIEMLRLALAERQSPWHDAVLALCATFPPLVGDEADAVARLIAQGPPTEDVGLLSTDLDPRLNPMPEDPPQPVTLGIDIPVGAPS